MADHPEAAPETGSPESGERFAGLTESLDAAIEKFAPGDGGTEDTAPESETEPEEEAVVEEEVAPQPDESESEEKGAEEAGDAEPADESEPGFYSLKEFESTDIFDLDMERVPPELRAQVRAAKKKITQGYQELAEKRRARNDDDDSRAKADAPKDPSDDLTDEELYELSMTSPEGYRKAREIEAQRLERQMLRTLKESGIDPDFAKAQQSEALVRRSLSVATDTYPELSDAKFRSEVGKAIENNERLAKLTLSEDPDLVVAAIEAAAARVKASMSNAELAKLRSERETAVKKEQEDKANREKKNAEQKGSRAAKETVKAPPPKSDKPPTLEEAMDNELKSGNYKFIR